MKKLYLILIPFIMNNGCSHPIDSLESAEVYQTNQMGFAQATIYNGLLYSSGQVGWDTNYQLTADGSFGEQLEQTFDNLNKILIEAGSSFSDVILIRFYVKELDAKKRNTIGKRIQTYFPNEYKPSSSLIGVAMLAREDLLVEIEIIAKTEK